MTQREVTMAKALCGDDARADIFALAADRERLIEAIQWEGPWTKPGVPLRARYRHTHWVAGARRNGSIGVFDINCINSGGWVSLEDWESVIVPHIVAATPRADGKWHITHSLEITSSEVAR